MIAAPFQKLCCIQPAEGSQPFLLAASGPIVHSFNLKDGSILSRWPAFDHEPSGQNGESANYGDGPPSKRRKLDDSSDLPHEDSEESIEIIAERKKGERRRPKVETSTLPNVSQIATTRTGKTVVCVTSEDKSVNVFDVDPGGGLCLLTQRSMPKRICSIVLSPDEKNILIGDKFGDVYLLPLHPDNEWTPAGIEAAEKSGAWTPSATELTVHTKGNLEALKQQRKLTTPQPRKEGMQFECKLLLGHVSLLTDVVISEIPIDLKSRQYILTADRDEHIRVSRGTTQAHIIENYCLGHHEFVSKLCIVPWNAEYLVAGSGEPALKVYRWRTGQLLDEELFERAVQQDIVGCFEPGEAERSFDHLSVSNVWPIHYRVSGNAPKSREAPKLLLVALEGLPLLLSYSLSHDGQLKHHQTLTLSGNILDVAIGPALWEIVVGIDTVHKPGSMKFLRSEEIPQTEFFETFELFSSMREINGHDHRVSHPEDDLRWERSSLAMALNSTAADVERGTLPAEAAARDKGWFSPAGELLYGLENLRKKRGQAAAEAEQEEAGDEAAVAPDL